MFLAELGKNYRTQIPDNLGGEQDPPIFNFRKMFESQEY